MPQPNDLSRSLVAFDQNSMIIAVVELSHSSWLVGGMFRALSVSRARSWSRAHVKAPAPGLDRTDAVGLDMACRGSDPPGTVSSNPSLSSGESSKLRFYRGKTASSESCKRPRRRASRFGAIGDMRTNAQPASRNERITWITSPSCRTAMGRPQRRKTFSMGRLRESTSASSRSRPFTRAMAMI